MHVEEQDPASSSLSLHAILLTSRMYFLCVIIVSRLQGHCKN